MADTLKVRMYNVRFGDAILVIVPDRRPSSGKTTRYILIDVGNAPAVAGTGGGGEDTVFEPVIRDILDTLNGSHLDLYVMTHEHLDHVQGLFHAATRLPGLDLANRLKVDYVWLTASSHAGYYDSHPDARKKKLEFDEMHRRLSSFFTLNMDRAWPGLLQILANNDPTRTAQCVDYLRNLNAQRTTYVYRGMPMNGTHPFEEAQLSVWAPEEDTSDYYGPFQRLDAGAVPQVADVPAAPGATPLPPQGVDVGAFLDLLEARRGGIADNLLAIDQAANNTSIVFALEWRGWRLLFPGDAEVRSWKTMHREGALRPVHFLKVAHHGSHNGTPADDILDAILPLPPPDARPRTAAISTWRDTYNGIPHPPTNDRLSSRAVLRTTLDNPTQLFYDVEFRG